MPKVKVICEECGKELERYPCEIFKHIFCSRECSKKYLSIKMSNLNKELNPSRMTDEVKEKVRQARLDTGAGDGYRKIKGRHEHRIRAEQILGRKLMQGEVVHHIDGNKRNNAPNNLKVFKNQQQHAKFHKLENKFFLEGVVPNEI